MSKNNIIELSSREMSGFSTCETNQASFGMI